MYLSAFIARPNAEVQSFQFIVWSKSVALACRPCVLKLAPCGRSSQTLFTTLTMSLGVSKVADAMILDNWPKKASRSSWPKFVHHRLVKRNPIPFSNPTNQWKTFKNKPCSANPCGYDLYVRTQLIPIWRFASAWGPGGRKGNKNFSLPGTCCLFVRATLGAIGCCTFPTLPQDKGLQLQPVYLNPFLCHCSKCKG